jgi:hypothetical protein
MIVLSSLTWYQVTWNWFSVRMYTLLTLVPTFVYIYSFHNCTLPLAQNNSRSTPWIAAIYAHPPIIFLALCLPVQDKQLSHYCSHSCTSPQHPPGIVLSGSRHLLLHQDKHLLVCFDHSLGRLSGRLLGPSITPKNATLTPPQTAADILFRRVFGRYW